MTNRPTHAPDRRPGETIDPIAYGTELVTLHLHLTDARELLAFLEAGIAASVPLESGAGTVVEHNRRRARRLNASSIAHALDRETRRIRARNGLTKTLERQQRRRQA